MIALGAFGGEEKGERGNGGGDLAGFKSDGNERNVMGGYCTCKSGNLTDLLRAVKWAVLANQISKNNRGSPEGIEVYSDWSMGDIWLHPIRAEWQCAFNPNRENAVLRMISLWFL